jgi:antitoxin (DNA-binding transcriptional repressor) of toxin-antitoxin stability system
MLDHVRAGETVALTEDGKTVAEFRPKIVANENMSTQSSDELQKMRQMFKGVTLEDLMSARHEGHRY